MLKPRPLLRRIRACLARFARQARDWWAGLSWGLRMVACGVAILAAMTAVRLAPGSWREFADGAGVALFYGTLLLTGYPRIKDLKEAANRTAARPAVVIAAVGAALATAGPFLAYDSLTRWAERSSLAGGFLLLAALALFAVISEVTRAVRILGGAAVVIGSVLLMVAILLFSPITVFLMANGRWPAPLLGGPVEPGWLDLIAMVPPATLLLGPVLLRQLLPWDQAEETTQRLASAWLAGLAVFFTCAYALILHYVADTPLTAMSLSGLALAAVFVAAFLWPLYKRIAESFWRWGLADAVKLTNWRREQREAAKQVTDAIRAAVRSGRSASSDQANPVPEIPEPAPGPGLLDAPSRGHESDPTSAEQPG
jgi:hypothetical protein